MYQVLTCTYITYTLLVLLCESEEAKGMSANAVRRKRRGDVEEESMFNFLKH
jgi:hypothetical protein